VSSVRLEQPSPEATVLSAGWRPRGSWWATLVLGAPFIGVLALRAPVINQISYIDGWFYSGYGWSLTHGLRVFEDTY
jgi:hypothetical protein